MPVFKLKCRGVIVGYYKTRERLNSAMDKILKYDPDAKASMHVLIEWN